MSDPTTFDEVFKFYNEYVKLLYCRVQTSNVLPLEVLFELNAAFDHISRRWIYDEPEEQVVSKVYSHLKRSCLDIFKIIAKDALDHYEELKKVDLSLINNGQFENQLRRLMVNLKSGIAEARRWEGYTSNDEGAAVKAFEKWQPVFEMCEEFEEKFYKNEHIDWAKGKTFRLTWSKFFIGIVSSSLATALLKDRAAAAFISLYNLVMAHFPK